MSFRTNPQVLRNSNSWPLEIPITRINFFRQNFIIYTYINNLLALNLKKLINYSCKVNIKIWYIWITYYGYLYSKHKIKSKISSNNDLNLILLSYKNIILSYKFCFQKQFNTLFFFTKICSYIIKKRSNVLRYFYNNQNNSLKFDYLKKKNIYLKKKRLLKRKLQAIFKNQVLNLYLTKYLTKHFSITTQIYIKNIKNFLKNSARKLNKILFKQLRFNKQVKFLKNIIYILNISTYCKSAYFFSEYIAAQLCKSRKQWLIINITTQIITKILKVRLNIKGCKILISGRLQGRDRKKTFLKVFGLLPLQVFSSKISYSLSQNYNVFGAFGVKIWLYYL